MTNNASPFPIRIRLSERLRAELSACEEGSYSDMQAEADAGREPDRPLSSHTHIIASRKPRGFLVIRNAAEADDVYYSVCSGTFALREKTDEFPGNLRAARRIANILRPYAKPETVRMFPHADGY